MGFSYETYMALSISCSVIKKLQKSKPRTQNPSHEEETERGEQAPNYATWKEEEINNTLH